MKMVLFINLIIKVGYMLIRKLFGHQFLLLTVVINLQRILHIKDKILHLKLKLRLKRKLNKKLLIYDKGLH